MENAGTTTNAGSAAAEYAEALTTIRHYSNLRFAVLTVFVAIVSGLFAVAFGLIGDVPAKPILPIGAKVLGLAVTIIFYTFEDAIYRNMDMFGKRACELEKHLGYTLWSNRPRPLGTRIATISLYLIVAVSWLLAFCC